ncbi:hypothetical protein UFOVP916_61 [uncultured Caudovirales phage]|uniref:PD-(D/E)XK nuclease superfamily n=1 Tax=uncultured Caudovirales phage TaxID=2100421 RepID=A0A6J5S0D3_9CAUD|nr:hypothetical protein UFOVP827_16 [uncultured Caudovirales phage]CAB4171490.1 hypothetical protein UFOVP916_61 [uncultured Caudovirales phage]CAB4177319.1 hypothetical protein UFOVP1001_19 [uncultured Caudovirales phage]CAB4199548.1 hypothetical protein UFOVP1338_57 [uncultured Caudovirales phage]CAB4213533.1 hypothetical protein UFOVP1447_52 [uncultured Caudovirales phage]
MKKPSVTELLQLLNKPALIGWANKQGLLGIDINKAKKVWLNDGSSIHNQIEKFIKDGEPFINSEHQKKFIEFISDKEILGLEQNIETDWFIGRYDMKIKWNGKIYLIDFKINHKNIYLENRLQLVGYSMAEHCDSFAIVSVPDFTVMNFKIENRTPYEDMLKSLSIIYKSKNQIENGTI